MNNNRASADIPLTNFGGLCAEIAPTDLPEGASPLNYDVDYDIGAVYTRAGLDNVYSFEALSSGPNYSHASDQIAVNNVKWVNYQGQYLVVTWLNGQSPILWWNDFGFDVAPTGVTGVEIAISGHFGGTVSPECVCQLTLTQDGKGIGQAKHFFFQNAESTVTLGGPSDTWAGTEISHINQPAFGAIFYGISPGMTSTLYITAITMKVYLAQGNDNIDWVKTFIEDDQHTHTFVLDSAGTLWEEDVSEAPGVLVPQTSVIPPNTFAASATNLNEEWIAFSDLKQGTAIPRHGSNLDRISQVGPGVGPSVVGMAGTGPNATTWPVGTINQELANTSRPNRPHGFYDILWSVGANQQAPGNVLTIYYASESDGPDFVLASYFALGGAVAISGLPAPFQGLDGTYLITSMNFGTPPGAGHNYYYFTVQTASTSMGPPNNNLGSGGSPAAWGYYQPTMATMTLAPGTSASIQVGQQISIQGNSAAGYNGTWTVLSAQNGGQYTITETSLTNGVATYTFLPIAGVTAVPAVGEFVTVTGSTNGPVDPNTQASIFDVVQTPITAVSGDTFSVSLPGRGDVPAAVEVQAQAIVFGTVYMFDPGLSFLGTHPATDPGSSFGIFGTGTGGLVTIGGNIGAGIRSAVTIFQTRNGYLTAPSRPTLFETTTDANTLMVSNIAIGPPNVIARIIAFTPAGGGYYFYIPQPVVITGVGQKITYSATVINDNITTQTPPPGFNFTDAVLMAATSIDTPGNDLFNMIEVGSSGAVVPYGERNFYIMQQNKVQNFVNTTFDGGYLTPGVFNLPAGWTGADANKNETTYAHITNSPIFGFSYYIQNQTGSTQSSLGIITQGAYQDAYQVPILRINTTYSVRAWVRIPSGIHDPTGQAALVIDVTAYSTGIQYGVAYFNFSELSSEFQEFTVPLITTPIPPTGNPPGVPTDLILRVYAGSIPAGADVEIDRFEIFPTNEPDLVTDVYGSYVGNLEAVDGVSGDLGASVQNNQPVLGAFSQYDLLYLLKSGSMLSTQDSPSEEPAEWKIREVSNKVGTAGFLSYDYGEEWMITANRRGVYIFSGREPIKISQEIQPVWDAINWAFGHTIVVRNDVASRRLFIHIPIPTPNPWLPDASLNPNPTTPNVILMMSYKELQTAAALEERGPVKISFSGKLISWDMSRKWSIWQIPSPYSAFVARPDGTDQYFIGNGRQNSRVYMLDQNSLSDDGLPIPGLYTTYGFVEGEQARQYGPALSIYRKLFKYSSYNLSGAGNLRLRALLNTLMPPYPYEVPGGIDLTCPGDSYREVPFNLEGQRMFLEFSTNHAQANFRLSEIILSVAKSAWAPVRGIN